jgi:hypothetical protein
VVVAMSLLGVLLLVAVVEMLRILGLYPLNKEV